MNKGSSTTLTLEKVLELTGYKNLNEVPGGTRTLPFLAEWVEDSLKEYGEQWIIDNRNAVRKSMEHLASL